MNEDPAGRLAGERHDYLAGSLADDAPSDPLALFDIWMDEAFARRDEQGDLTDPSAVVLSTVAMDAMGRPRPRSRTVLLKGHDGEGFVLYTNLTSPKATELDAAPHAALLLPWYPMQRQVRIEGAVSHLSDAESDAYWAQRPRGAQLGAWASHQSRPIASRAALDAQYDEVEARFEGHEVSRPPFWGGLRVLAERMEFWQGRENRFHDRIAYDRAADGAWQRHRLQP
ncbi:pyridoxamine 5'-phosphate oxidase [Brachybacterium sp. GCM10030267]|uniref:pyridoxamine 5'-phosphate oxidase n=1 Tax=unclassified Brachybacterium TaxID=2623841 RepID=UPI00361E8AF0